MDDYVSKPVRSEDTIRQKWVQLTPEAPLHPASPAPTVIDAETFAALKALYDDEGQAFLVSLIEQFVQHAATQVDTLRVAATGDPTALERLACRLKSSSARIGALGMAELCRQLQTLGLTGTVAGAAGVVEELEGEFDRVRRALAQECSKQTTDGDHSPHRV